MSAARVLVVDDDVTVCLAIRTTLEAAGHIVAQAASAELGLDAARDAPPDLVLLDVHLPGRSGIDVLPELTGLPRPPSVVVMTSHATAETAIDAMARGASAHVEKPIRPDALLAVVGRALGERAEAAADVAPDPTAGAADDAGPRLVGRSAAMLELGERVGALARTDAGVLIRGESGTGKELVARAIHERSARGGPFVAVSCAALPDTLIEAELFGHERGAFTGGDRERKGRIERADGGTLLLDEVGELSLGAQVKLLRFLEERTVDRLGGGDPRVVDVRVLAATNAPLEGRVESGDFRADLYYRLNVVTVVLPPLRERKEDIPRVVDHFLATLAPGRNLRVDEAALAALAARDWPGNVRELRNAVTAALVAAGRGKEIRVEHLPPPGPRLGGGAIDAEGGAAGEPAAAVSAAVKRLVADALARPRASGGGGDASDDGDGADEGGARLFADVRTLVERALIEAALDASGGNQVQAARFLEMNRATLRRKMKGFGLL